LLLIGALGVVATALWWALSATKASFLSINAHSDAYYKRTAHRFEIFKYGVVLASVVAIICGIFVNTIYDFLKSLNLL
jgi:hypothetical protein